ncbi:hypothetical protein O3P69_007353 [Scylla paramamosain]|uniref:K Homology domain-containing protein n=1 Tax=Scylla paramamosain TaxID=85552 RepID=A0AAW0V5U4_SCYPA
MHLPQCPECPITTPSTTQASHSQPPQQIERLQNGVRVSTKNEERKMADVTKDKAIKLTVRVLVPVRDHPKFNFVGKLLGPKGNSLKRLQEETMTKMAILGRGSMRDKQKEEELRQSGDPKFGHLSEDLHVEVTAVAPPAEAHARIAYALTEIRRYLVPDYNDEIRQGQMREMQLLVGSNTSSLTTTATTTTTTTASTNNNNINNNNNNNNGTTCGSEEESCSPHSSGSPPPPPGVGAGGGRSGGGGGGGVRGSNSLSLSSPHPALRGLNRAQAALLTAAGKGELVKGRAGSGVGVGGAGHSGSNRRSVLSLLTRARAIQQKEELMDAAYHDLPGSRGRRRGTQDDQPGGARQVQTRSLPQNSFLYLDQQTQRRRHPSLVPRPWSVLGGVRDWLAELAG